jgi:hypothetical protein
MLRLAKPLVTMFISVAKFNTITMVDVQLSELLLTLHYADFHVWICHALEHFAIGKMNQEVKVMHLVFSFCC